VLDSFIPPHGGYKNLLTYRKSQIIYDATVYFTRRFFRKGDRTVDQMVQAARSGKQNIIEGSMASGTSKETEVKLTNVARASLEELPEDYCDFLRVNSFTEWSPEHPCTKRLRQINRATDADYEAFRKGIEHENPEICANVIFGLIKVCNYLLERQLHHLEKEFIQQGGLRERMTQARLHHRGKGKK